MTCWQLVFCLLVVLSLPIQAGSGIIGDKDDRTEVVFPETPGSQYLGAVFYNGKLNGTGVLVGPRHMLSAAHVWAKAVGADGKPVTKNVQFHLHYQKGKATQVLTIDKVDYWHGYRSGDSGTKRDWVLAILSEPVGLQFGWVDLVAQHPRDAVRIHSYGYGGLFKGEFTPSVASVHLNCQTYPNIQNDQTEMGQVATNCDGPPGSSGGPNLRQIRYANPTFKDRFQLLGINTQYSNDFTYYLPSDVFYDQWLGSVAWRYEIEVLTRLKTFFKAVVEKINDSEKSSAIKQYLSKVDKDYELLSEAELHSYYHRTLGAGWKVKIHDYLRDLKHMGDLIQLPISMYSLGATFDDEYAPLVVTKTDENSEARKAGLLPGDTITKMKGVWKADGEDYEIQFPCLQQLKIGMVGTRGKFSVSVRREKQIHSLNFELTAKSDEQVVKSLSENMEKIISIGERYLPKEK